MKKLAIFSTYVCLAVIAAALFGALHDQISYSVSSEYFTRFKFLRFGLDDAAVPERIRAAQVGFLASWWMGVPLGTLAGAAGFLHGTPAAMRRALLLSLPLIVVFTLTFALGGLAWGMWKTVDFDIGAYGGWYIPARLVHPRAFICVAYMHSAAYLGGILAIPAAWLFHLGIRRRTP